MIQVMMIYVYACVCPKTKGKPCEHKHMSLILRTHTASIVECACNPSAGEEETVDPWS